MTSATDIITYIGIPLAVLGVLPILYTFVLAIFTRQRIRALLLHHGHKPLSTTRPNDGFTIRSSPMTTLIEVELPRYTIAPLARGDEDYWKSTEEDGHGSEENDRLLNRAQSTLSMVEEGRVSGYLRGGSWRAFHWKRLLVGKKLYRIQYEDELREPQAEIDFSELVHFLLDRGAVPDSMGWEKLRSNGLWTPAGTVLLRQPDNDADMKPQHVDWVLRTTLADESDGVLSLTVHWSYDHPGDARGAASLPPGWGRLIQPVSVTSGKEKAVEDRQDLTDRLHTLKYASKYASTSSSVRFRAEDNFISKILWEDSNIETGFVSLPFGSLPPSASAWFTSIVAALLTTQTPPTSLWNFEIPSSISTFAHRDSMPCGVLVLLGILPEDLAPHWSQEPSTQTHTSNKHHQRFMADMEAKRMEASLPPDQARIARMNREAQRRREMVQEMADETVVRRERDERRIADALASPRMSIKAVAEACLMWLIEQGEIDREWTVEELTEAVAYMIVLDQSEEGQARKLIRILDEWSDWCTAGGMKRQQYHLLQDLKVELCFAAAMVATIASSSSSINGQASKDMLECLKNWRKVRLG